MVWTINRVVALIIGIVFTVLGIAGFTVTTSMTREVILTIDVDLVHNIIYLVTGIIALIAVFTGWTRIFNELFGVLFILIGIMGLFYPVFYINNMLLGVTHVNASGHALHLIVGVLAAGAGFFAPDVFPQRPGPGTSEPVAETSSPIRDTETPPSDTPPASTV